MVTLCHLRASLGRKGMVFEGDMLEKVINVNDICQGDDTLKIQRVNSCGGASISNTCHSNQTR